MTFRPLLFLFITVSSLLCSFCAAVVCSLLLYFTWKRKWQPTPVLPGKSHGQEPGRLPSIGSQKRRTQFSDWTTTTLSFYPSSFHMYSLVNCWSVWFSHSVVIQSFFFSLSSRSYLCNIGKTFVSVYVSVSILWKGTINDTLVVMKARLQSEVRYICFPYKIYSHCWSREENKYWNNFL